MNRKIVEAEDGPALLVIEARAGWRLGGRWWDCFGVDILFTWGLAVFTEGPSLILLAVSWLLRGFQRLHGLFWVLWWATFGL